MKRKTAKKKPGLTAKPLGEHFKETPIIPSVDDGAIRVTSDGEWVWESKPTTEIEGVPLPPDLELAVGHYAEHVFGDCRDTLCFPPLEDVTDEEGPEDPDGMPRARRLRTSPPPGWKEADLTPDGWRTIGEAIKTAFRSGFYLALLRYADDLKHVPEVAAFLEQRRENGELLAAEGRAVKAKIDNERAAMVCQLYKAVRPSFPEGRKGNGSAHRRVAERFEQRTGKSITVRAVREILKRSGAV